jgi:phytoene dehydrogenase-like protein
VVTLVGAGLGGFVVVGAILNTLYGKQVAIFESHYLPGGGCTHVFDCKAANGETFKFDYVPTIVLLLQ